MAYSGAAFDFCQACAEYSTQRLFPMFAYVTLSLFFVIQPYYTPHRRLIKQGEFGGGNVSVCVVDSDEIY